VLVVEASRDSADVLTQIFRGFGVAQVAAALSTAAAEAALRERSIDLMVIDPAVSDSDGYRLLRSLRQSASNNAYVPVVLISGHVRASDVTRARDTGANFFVTKPITPITLLQRILFVARDRRPFVEAAGYVGPDRRFRFEGPPPGIAGRREEDVLRDEVLPYRRQGDGDMMMDIEQVMI